VYQGGIRVPFSLRWPSRCKPGRIDRIAAHIDVVPTLVEACGAKLPTDRAIDGRSLMPLLRGEASTWPGRTLYTQWHRGEVPELFRSCAARTQQYKLINGKELYDLAADPAESRDIASTQPRIVAEMRQGVERWFADVGATRGYAPPRIHLGSPRENPATLTRQDWRGPRAGWDAGSIGHWEVQIAQPGTYRVSARFAAAPAAMEAALTVAGHTALSPVRQGDSSARFAQLELETGPTRLECTLHTETTALGVQYVDVERI
jgi:hypothetical protein